MSSGGGQVAGALLLDAGFGEPPEVVHPTVWMGRVISAFEKRALSLEGPGSRRLAGIVLALSLPALRVAEIARRIGVGEVFVVTDPLHCVRTVACFGRVGLRAVAEPVYSSPMWRKKWSRRGQFLRESGALVWYRIRHGIGSHSRP
jgi:cobalamin biosynthesis protein CobD/CbiB